MTIDYEQEVEMALENVYEKAKSPTGPEYEAGRQNLLNGLEEHFGITKEMLVERVKKDVENNIPLSISLSDIIKELVVKVIWSQ